MFRTRTNSAPAALVVVAFAMGAPPAPVAAPPAPATEQASSRSADVEHDPGARERETELAATHFPVRYDRLQVFGGLGAWVDMYDYASLDARRTTRSLARNGVRTLYAQTGWPSTSEPVVDAAGDWLVAGQRAGLKVVGWYLPHYADVAHDVRRTVAIATYQRGKHRFDGLGIDVEFRSAVPDRATWMRRVAQHARAVRRELPRYPIATIPPTPLQMRVAPTYWAGFPWRALAANSDIIMLMSYWSDRSGCPEIRRHCAYEFTKRNVRMTRKLSGVPEMPVHIIGGVGDRITGRELRDFVRGALAAGADGASIYDVATTHPDWWRALRRLRPLGTDPFGGAALLVP